MATNNQSTQATKTQKDILGELFLLSLKDLSRKTAEEVLLCGLKNLYVQELEEISTCGTQSPHSLVGLDLGSSHIRFAMGRTVFAFLAIESTIKSIIDAEVLKNLRSRLKSRAQELCFDGDEAVTKNWLHQMEENFHAGKASTRTPNAPASQPRNDRPSVPPTVAQPPRARAAIPPPAPVATATQVPSPKKDAQAETVRSGSSRPAPAADAPSAVQLRIESINATFAKGGDVPQVALRLVGEILREQLDYEDAVLEHVRSFMEKYHAEGGAQGKSAGLRAKKWLKTHVDNYYRRQSETRGSLATAHQQHANA